jgi:RNA recognition motif-containing protein
VVSSSFTSGQIIRAEVAGKGKSKGFGTIQFSKHPEALKAIDEFNGADLDGRTIEVRWDKGQTQKQRKVIPKKADFAPANSNCLFVGNLSWTTTSEDLINLFSTVVKVVDGQVVVASNGKSRGYGIVTLSTVSDAKLAQEKFNGYIFNER